MAADEAAGLALIEDFGQRTYPRLLAAEHAEQRLYELAVDCLVALHQARPALGAALPACRGARLAEEFALFGDGYLPLLTGQACAPGLRQQYLALFAERCAGVAARREVVVLRDHHLDNLMLLGGCDGVAACGLLDFQDALHGAAAYDLPSLLGDYAVLAAQRHAKVLGIFVRLAERNGRLAYLDQLPRVQRLFQHALEPSGELLYRQVAAWRDGVPVDAIAALRERTCRLPQDYP